MLFRSYISEDSVVSSSNVKLKKQDEISDRTHPPMEFCIGPNPDLEIGQPTDYSFACRTNADFKRELVKGKLPTGVTFQNGKLAGTPTEAGKYPITLQLSANNKNSITKDFELLV